MRDFWQAPFAEAEGDYKKQGTITMVVGSKLNGTGHWEWYSLTTPCTMGTGKLLCAVRIKLYCIACCRMDQWQGISAR